MVCGWAICCEEMKRAHQNNHCIGSQMDSEKEGELRAHGDENPLSLF